MSLFLCIHAWALVCPGGTWGPQELGEPQGAAGALSPSFGASIRAGVAGLPWLARVGPVTETPPRREPRFVPKLGLKARAACCGSPNPRGRRCAYSVGGMNDGVAGGALAAGDAGKPGAPEAATRAGESGGRRGGIGGVSALGARDHVTILAAPTSVHPLLPPPLAVSSAVTCLLARWGSGAISGLGGGRCRTFGDSDDSADKDNHPNNNH